MSSLPLAQEAVVDDLPPSALPDLRRAIDAKLAELQKTIELRLTQGVDAALAVVRTDVGKRLMDECRNQVRIMAETSEADLRRAEQSADALVASRMTIFVVSVIINLLFLGWAYVQIRRETRRREAAAREVQQQKDFLAVTLASIGDAVIVRDLAGRVSYMNKAAEELAGRHLKQASIEPLFRAQQMLPSLENEPRGELLEVQRMDGERRTMIRRASSLGSDGEGGGRVEVLSDVTALRRTEAELRQLTRTLERRVEERTRQLSEANAELEAFAYTMAHDLRAPLRGMEGFSRALLEDHADKLGPEGQDYAARIVDAARRLESLIQDLLAYSRVTREEMSVERVELGPPVQRVVDDARAELDARRAEVRVEQPMPAVLAHRGMLAQVVMNLLSNSIKFVSPGRPPRVSIAAQVRGPKVRLWVEDNGIGIAPEHQQRIFNVFERLHGAEAYPGTGIGLAIVRRGVVRMGGSVGVESKLGEGSRFWIELPRAVEAGS
jgi:PAS domain S-box-containing protein